MITRDIWLKEKHEYNLKGNWPCPTCGKGTLFPDEKKKLIAESAQTLKGNGDEFFEPWMAKMRFSAVLQCSNNICNETVIVVGALEYGLDYVYDEGRYEMQEVYPNIFNPILFFPELQIFTIPDNCPDEIKTQLRLAFSHFFHDQSASANSIRTALEILMNEQGVKKTFVNKHGKRDNYNLHQRIEFFGKSNPELKHYLMAAKWIGNAGSHIGKLSREDLLDGFELLQHAIDELYVKPHRLKELKSKSQAINKRKKPISTKKKNP